MKRTTKYINQFNPDQKSLLDTDEEQIKQHALKQLRVLKEEFKAKAEEGKRKQRITMLGEKR